jgi:hypothetical protein
MERFVRLTRRGGVLLVAAVTVVVTLIALVVAARHGAFDGVGAWALLAVAVGAALPVMAVGAVWLEKQ